MFVDRTQAASAEEIAEWSDEAAIACDPREDKTRQEFAAEADINTLLRRFGAGGMEMRPVVYGIQDTDLELQQVYAAVEVSENAWARLPENLRARYSDWSELLAAVERGEAQLKDPEGKVTEPVKPDPVVPVAS